MFHNFHFHRRIPGKRRDAGEILRLVSLLSTGTCFLCAAMGGILGIILGKSQLGIGVAIGLFAVCISNMFSWIFEAHITAKFPKYSVLSSLVSYGGKILLVFIALVVVRVGNFASLGGVCGGFIAGLLISLCIASLIILRAPGPDFSTSDL